MAFDLFGIKFNIRKGVIVAGALALLVLGSITGYLLVRDDSDIIVETHGERDAPKGAAGQTEGATTAQAAAASVPAPEKEIKVYVTGCVNKPGIVILAKGKLIDDAIRLAGGATPEADIEEINLVYELKENLMLHIKAKGEGEKDGTGASGEAGKGAKVVRDSGGTVVNGSGGGGGGGKNGLININTASPEELDKLPGIGEATARDIIAYRESNGPFRTIEDIMKVPRIKGSRFASIKDFITVD